MTTLREEFETRDTEHGKSYQHEEHGELIAALKAISASMFELAFDKGDHLTILMTTVGRVLSTSEPGEIKWGVVLDQRQLKDLDWRKEWEALEEDREPQYHASPLANDLLDLNSFANFGVIDTWAITDAPESHDARLTDTPAWVASVCDRIDRLEKLLPEDQRSIITKMIETRDRARARIKHERSEPLTIAELAHLSGASLKRVQNAAYSKADSAPRPGKDGLIPHPACQTWLNEQGYLPSLWREVAALHPLQDDWGMNIPYDNEAASEEHDDFIFIPVAADGTEFTPALWRDTRSAAHGGFTIGAKGAEHVIEDFGEALEQLRRMDKPRWRRPNDNGNWGIVGAETWRRVRRSSLPETAQ